ncbi:pantoate--beta-alanine ligase [Amphibacillus sp. Q70]|uniref:pantoate--beta-alanine ligase n=1 Tax=Amphibacillus sp. Q70 TaxID=3453416 RepID=UPI003F84DD6F
MEIIRTVTGIQTKMKYLKQAGKSIGYVPTMGYLHDGHLALVKEARKEADIVVLSIFVNPLQFGENEDFDQYPRDEEKDRSLAKEHGVDLVFIPDVKEMYPSPMGITMSINKRVGVLCDRTRPGHFQGVLTVLTKLFHLIQPDYSYFGMKDAQQMAIVDLLITELNFPVQLRMVPTVREPDGLAKSSRNVNLSDSERKEASHLYQALKLAEQKIIDGEKRPVKIVEEVKTYLNKKVSGRIDYIELLSFPNLTEIETIHQQIIIALAVQFKKTRLIDNHILTVKS